MDGVEEIMHHIDTCVGPWIEKVNALDSIISGKNGEGLKTRMAVMETDILAFKSAIREQILSMEKNIGERLVDLERKSDRAMWFSLTTVITTLISIILIVMFK